MIAHAPAEARAANFPEGRPGAGHPRSEPTD